MDFDASWLPERSPYFQVGSWIEHQHLRGEVVGVNFRERTMHVRVTAVSGHGPRNRIGRMIDVPFDCGAQIARP